MDLCEVAERRPWLTSAVAAALIGVFYVGLAAGKIYPVGAATATTVGTGPLAKPTNAPSGLALAITPISPKIQSGQPLVLRLVLRNRGRATLRVFLDAWGSILTRISVAGPVRGKAATLTRLGQHPAWRYPSFVGGHWVMHARRGGGIVTSLLPGKSVVFLSGYVPPPFFDMSVPGKYRVQVAMASIVSNVATIHVAASGTQPVSKPLLLVPLGIRRRTRVGVQWGKSWHGLELRICQLLTGTTRTSVVLRNVGKTPVRLGLTGASAYDFAVAATGPEAGFLRPGAAPQQLATFHGKRVPASAFGARLAAGGTPGTLRRATYVLLPGKEYRYTGYLVISSRLDMSLPGKYRVWVRLVGTGCLSNTITIP